LRVVDLYNTCIDSDNVLYPHSNYRKCFSPKNTVYVCSKISLLSAKEKNICSNFVLPSIAFTNLNKNIHGVVPKYFCQGYENKIISNYDNHVKVKLIII